MRAEFDERLRAELGKIIDGEANDDLMAAVRDALTGSVRTILDQLTTVRHLLMYFNTQADWNGVLGVIRDMVNADAVQVVCLEGLDDLSYHLLPSDQAVDEDFASLLHDGLTVDDQTPDGATRLGILLSVNEDLLGILMVMRNKGEPFSDFDRVLLHHFADEIAITLHNLQLYGLIREQADRLANLLHRRRGYGKGSSAGH
jgi:transcriptional regulator with GAF, ATPase, and Fis domain